MKTGRKLKTDEMEVALAEYFDSRANLIVPNVSWSFFLHELDLMVVTKSGYAYEVEVKITAADLKKDAEKKHGHIDRRIKKLYFAIPDYLLKYGECIPERAGILLVFEDEYETYYYNKRLNEKSIVKKCIAVVLCRKAKANSKYKFTDMERHYIARLGAMRIWGLKKRMIKGRCGT